MPTLYFVRHGETDWNREARLQGQKDVPLNALGEAQADSVGVHLAAALGGAERLKTISFIASPLGRTRRTAERLRSALGLDPFAYAMDARLKEVSFGAWEGFTWREIRARDPDGAKAREADKWGFRPPHGESYLDLSHRIAGWLNDISEDTVIVGHGGVARVLLVLVCGFEPQAATVEDIWQGKVLVLSSSGAHWVPGVGDAGSGLALGAR